MLIRGEYFVGCFQTSFLNRKICFCWVFFKVLISFFDFNHVNFFLLNFIFGITIFGNMAEFITSITFFFACWGVGWLFCRFFFVKL